MCSCAAPPWSCCLKCSVLKGPYTKISRGGPAPVRPGRTMQPATRRWHAPEWLSRKPCSPTKTPPPAVWCFSPVSLTITPQNPAAPAIPAPNPGIRVPSRRRRSPPPPAPSPQQGWRSPRVNSGLLGWTSWWGIPRPPEPASPPMSRQTQGMRWPA